MILTIIQLLFVSFVLYISYKFAVLPYTRMQFYKKQGLKTEFIPLIGSFFFKMMQNLKKHNDTLYEHKTLPTTQPDLKVLVQNFGSGAIVLLCDPALKKEAAFNHNYYELPDVFGDLGKMFKNGLIGVNGEEWKKQRKIISQSFHFEFLKDNIPVMVNTTRQYMNELAKGKLEGVEVLKKIETVAGENIGRVFFSDNLKEYSIKGVQMPAFLMDISVKMGKAMISVGYLLFGPKYISKGLLASHREIIEEMKLLQETCRRMLNDRRKNDLQTKDLAWYLMESQKNANEEDRLTDDAIIANFAAFIAAGTNTTTHLVAMTLYALTQNPEMLKKLREEIKEVYEAEDIVSAESLNKMNWLTALFKETLRIYNPVGTGSGFRQAIKDHKLGDISIKKGTTVSSSFIHTHFSPKYFENPMEYRPERWIEKPTLSEPYAYTPFWAGSRNCIGQHLAMIEGKIILCEFVRQFDFEMIDGYKLKLGNRQAYGPMDNLPMNLKAHKEGL